MYDNSILSSLDYVGMGSNVSYHFNKSKGILIIRVYCVGRYLYIKAYYSTKTFRIRSFKCLHKEFVIKGRQESLSSTTYKEYVIEPAKRAAEQILMWNHGLPRKKSKVDLSQLWWNKD